MKKKINEISTGVKLEDLIDMNKRGFNARQASMMLGIGSSSIYRACRIYKFSFDKLKCGIKKNDNFFEIIDTEEKAYALGFILADGCVTIEPKKKPGIVSKRLSLFNSIDDEEVLLKIREWIAPDAKVKYSHTTKGAKNRKTQLMIRFSSTKIVDDLMSKYNINPKKTQDIDFMFPFEKISSDMLYHFIRGFFDGDGWCTKSGNFGFVSTSKKFLLQLQNIIKLEKSKSSIYSTQGKNMIFHQLTYNNLATSKLSTRDRARYKVAAIEEIMKKLYDNANHYLSRKKDKFVKKLEESRKMITKDYGPKLSGSNQFGKWSKR